MMLTIKRGVEKSKLLAFFANVFDSRPAFAWAPKVKTVAF